MAWVIGEYGANPASTGSPSELSTPILWAQGQWPLGIAPGVWTIAVPGAFVEGNPEFVTPGSRKGLSCGDMAEGGGNDQTIAFNHLWVVSSEFSERRTGNSVCHITLKDQRMWWNSRFPIGPTSWNTPYAGEIVSPQTLTGGGAAASIRPENPRYPAHKMATVEEILATIFDCLGIEPGLQVLGARTPGVPVRGFLSGTEVFTDSYAEPGRTVLVWEDTPEFICPRGMSAVEALQKLLDMYDLTVGLDPEDGRVGLVPLSGAPEHLADVQDAIDSMSYPGGSADVSHPVEASGESFQPDDLPDVIQVTGEHIALRGKKAAWPVVRDPDRPGKFIPLDRVATMWALGVNMNALDRQHIRDGEDVIRLAYSLSTAANDWAGIPDRIKPIAREAFTLWQVGQPREICSDALVAQGSVETIVDKITKVNLIGSEEIGVERRISPAYRWKRNNSLSLSTRAATAGTRRAYLDSVISNEAQPHRLGPVLEGLGSAPGSSGQGDVGVTTGIDPSWGQPRIHGANVVMRQVSTQSAGDASEDWVDVNFLPGHASNPPSHEDAVDLQLELSVVDPYELVFQTPQPIYGCDGRQGFRYRVDVIEAGEAEEGRPQPPPPPAPTSPPGLGLAGAGRAIIKSTGLDRFASFIPFAPLGAYVWNQAAAIYRTARLKAEGRQGPPPSGSGRITVGAVPRVPAPTRRSTRVSSPDRSLLVAMLDGQRAEGHGRTPEMLWDIQRGSQGEEKSPAGLPYIWIEYAHPIRVHNDLRDLTASHSKVPSGRTDPWPSDGQVPLVNPAFSPDTMPELPVDATLSRGHQLRVVEQPVNARLYCVEMRSLDHYTPTGGWKSGDLDGSLNFNDTVFVESLSAAGAYSFGAYAPVSDAHYESVKAAMRAKIGAFASKVEAYRQHATAAKGLTDSIFGLHRRFFPGHPDFIDAPTDGTSITISASPPRASMRLAVNVRSFRAFLNSAAVRREGMMMAHRANTGSIGAMSGGGGGFSSSSGDDGMGHAQQTGVAKPSGGAGGRGSPNDRAGVGHTPITISDRRADPVMRRRSGGRLDACFDELVKSYDDGTLMSKREGPMLRLAVPGDWNEMWLDRVPVDGGEMWCNLDGYSTRYPSARDEFHRDVGKTNGTFLHDSEAFPLVNARLIGKEGSGQERHGDVSVICPLTWYKRRLPAGHGPGDGGTWLARQGKRSEEEAATDRRHEVDFGELAELEIEDSGSPEKIPLLEGEGWVSTLIMFHEQWQMHPGSEDSPRHAHVIAGDKTGPFGEVNRENVLDWLLFKVASTTGSGGSVGDYCELLPEAPQGAFPTIDFSDMSYYMSIVHLVELVERVAKSSGASIADINARRAHALAKATASVLKKLWCTIQNHPDVRSNLPDLSTELATLGPDCMPLICQEPCEEPEGPVITGPGGGSGSGGGGGGGGGGGSGGGGGGSESEEEGSPQVGGSIPTGSIAGASSPGAGGGTWTRYTTPSGSTGFTFTPGGSPVPAPGTILGPPGP